jgi:hypothetical protein
VVSLHILPTLGCNMNIQSKERIEFSLKKERKN